MEISNICLKSLDEAEYELSWESEQLMRELAEMTDWDLSPVEAMPEPVKSYHYFSLIQIKWSREMRRLVVAVSIVLLASVYAARAANITYSIVDHPGSQADYNYPHGADTVFGSIITDGTLGPWTGDTSSHLVGGSLGFSCPAGTVSAPLVGISADFYATPTQLLLYLGHSCSFTANTSFPPSSNSVELGYANRTDPTQSRYFCHGQYDDYSGHWFGSSFDTSSNIPYDGEVITANNPWIIATAAPSTIDWKGESSASTNWNIAANWNPEPAVPNGAGTKVSFGNQTAANNVVDMISQGQTVV